MRKKIIVILIILSVSAFNLSAATLKLASLLPEGTEWNRSLQEMANDWRSISEGKIKVKIYPGGIAGGESDVIRKMRIGQIDMAVLSAVGMTSILPDSFAMSLPFLLENENELDFIVEEVTPIFDKAFEEKGFIVLAWSKSGWINFFSKEPVIEPEDMMPLKLAGSVTQPELADLYRKLGFNVVSIDTPDALMGLQSGMIDTIYASPMMAASYQWFGIANNMLDLKVSPVLGGIVISEKAWRKVPSAYREEFIEAAKIMAVDFYSEALALDAKALDVMLDNGLVLNEPAAGTRDNWRDLLGNDYSIMVGDGNFITSESFEEVSSMLENFRSR